MVTFKTLRASNLWAFLKLESSQTRGKVSLKVINHLPLWGLENEPNEEIKVKYSLLNIWKLKLTRNEATQSNIGPRLTVNATLRNFNLRLKIEKIISVHSRVKSKVNTILLILTRKPIMTKQTANIINLQNPSKPFSSNVHHFLPPQCIFFSTRKHFAICWKVR